MEENKPEVVEIEAVDEEGMVDALRFAMIQAKIAGQRNAVNEMIDRLVNVGWGRDKVLSKIGWLTTRVYFSKKEGIV